MTWAIFASDSHKSAVLPTPSGVTLGEPRRSVDGRVPCHHSFSDEDVAYLVERGAVVADALPGDWAEGEEV